MPGTVKASRCASIPNTSAAIPRIGPARIPGRVVIAGCARDCAAHLPAVLANIERAAQLFAEAAYIFIENDSRDDTLAVLERFAQGRVNVHIERVARLAASYSRRTERLALARNRYLEKVESPDLRSYDYLLIADMDDVNREPWDSQALRLAIAYLDSNRDYAGIFANQPVLYYDMWALRHPQLCPGDVWAEVMEYALHHPVTDAAAYEATFAKRLFHMPETQPAVEVESAFGALGIYWLSAVLDLRYSGTRLRSLSVGGRSVTVDWEECEHVPFNAGIRRRAGRLFVLPWLINSRTPPVGFNPTFFRSSYRAPGVPG